METRTYGIGHPKHKQDEIADRETVSKSGGDVKRDRDSRHMISLEYSDKFVGAHACRVTVFTRTLTAASATAGDGDA